MARKRRTFSQEFKDDAVAYVKRTGNSVTSCAKELGVSQSLLSKWVKDFDETGKVNHRGTGNFQSDEAKENARLKKELRDAKDAIEVLKKAMGILSE